MLTRSPFFHLWLIESGEFDSWLSLCGTQDHVAWCGHAFELVCLLHTSQMKRALGISGIETSECAWRTKKSTPAAQINLLIDRRDDVINVCEMKFANGEFAIDAGYEKALLNKLDAFEREVRSGNALHLTMVTSGGLARNAHADIVQRELTADDLFMHV